MLRQSKTRYTEASTISESHTEVLQQKLEEVKEILSVFGKGGDRSELLSVLKSFLAGYDPAFLPDHKDALILLISTQASHLCGFELSDREIETCFPEFNN